jgi:hypothetical protein
MNQKRAYPMNFLNGQVFGIQGGSKLVVQLEQPWTILNFQKNNF